MEWLVYVASGITYGSSVASVAGLISGYRLGKEVRNKLGSEVRDIGFNVNELSRQLKVLHETIPQELVGLDNKVIEIPGNIAKISNNQFEHDAESISFQNSETSQIHLPKNALKSTMMNTPMGVVCTDTYKSTPDGFDEYFRDNPRNFLFGIQAINDTAPDIKLLKDPTLVPWHFKENGQDMIGFVKKGYLMGEMGINFFPSISESPIREKYLAADPRFEGLSRNTLCPCKSGEKFKYCHGRISCKPIEPGLRSNFEECQNTKFFQIFDKKAVQNHFEKGSPKQTGWSMSLTSTPMRKV